MRVIGVAMYLVLAVACGDNTKPMGGQPVSQSPGASSAVGGAQVSRSESFMLVTSVSTENAQVLRSKNFVHKPSVGGGR